ncbi:A/G-specific adenine glycosylase [Candidatus Bipolaricaulota bacterium]|nr:A/G-specific adenine glycosylase [Candidatus Bipolaricaulota bacterium]
MRSNLLDWYAVEARDLPWRRTRDPYAILVSEIMLQQTRVDTVGRYYQRFLEQFPTVDALASAPLDQVLKAWEGLGYYRRAHALHAAAIHLVEQHEGRVPSSANALRRLPGVGPYTAAAVASIAFGRDEPVLDGNVVRVLTRLFAIPGDINRPETRRRLQSTAAALLPAGRAGDFNQSLMDLGSQVCVPRKPACASCPLSGLCSAYGQRRETDFPMRAPRRKIPHRDIVAGIIWDREPYSPEAKILISKRHHGDMLGGLWEFPGGHVEPAETLEAALMRELREELAIAVTEISSFMQVKHAYTHFRMTLHVFHCLHAAGEPQALASSEWTWTLINDLDRFAFPTADRKIIEHLNLIDKARRAKP